MDMRETYSLNGEWEFMPIYDDPMRRRLPEKEVYEQRKVRVPSSWRISYPQPNGNTFGRIPEYGYAPYDLHDYPPEWDRAEAGVLRRTFRVPEQMEGQRIVLRLDGIMQKAVIYLDRQEIAVWEDGYLPLRIDLGSKVRAGEEHELHVVCGGFDRTMLDNGTTKLTGLMGSWYGRIARGIWQDVYLESYPNVAFENAGIRTSVRQGKLEAEVWVGTSGELLDAERLSAFSVRLTIREKGLLARQPSRSSRTAANFGLSTSMAAADSEASDSRGGGGASPKKRGNDRTSTPVGGAGNLPKLDDSETVTTVMTCERPLRPADLAETLPLRLCEGDDQGAVGRADWTLNWSDAELWSPDSPFLYEAEFELLDGERIVDRLTETFGFREFWCEGPNFVLNGIPINLRGDSWHFQGEIQQTDEYVRNWYRMCREVGVNVVRLHAEPHPVNYLRIADEEGMLIVDETAIYGSSSVMKADHPDYLEACLKHVRRLARRDRNHPSIVMWSMQNEMRWVVGRDGFKSQIPILMDAIRALDPTRPLLVEGDNRLLPREQTEVESRHYNIDGTIDQWDRSVPLTFGEHGGWWYICPQNSSPYVGLRAYRGTDESSVGLAIGERLFIEYARRSGVASISTFNFAHYFMRAMPEEDIRLTGPGSGSADAAMPDGTPDQVGIPGVRPDKIPAYSLTLNNGLLPEEYPAYRPNPAFAILQEAFRPVTMIAAEYDRCFYDNERISRSFDVYNDTLQARRVRIDFAIRQGGETLREESVQFVQQPAERRLVGLNWMPLTEAAGGETTLSAVLSHDEQRVHQFEWTYRIVSADAKRASVEIGRPAAYWGRDAEYKVIRRLVPACERTRAERIASLPGGTLLIVGSHLGDPGLEAEVALADFVARGGRLLLLEQSQWSPGGLVLSRRPFLRAHGGDYGHPALAGIGHDDLMFWHEELREQGPLPIIQAAYEKPISGDLTLLLECGAGDFGDGGDLWSPLLEYRSGQGLLLANQLELMANLEQVPQAALLLRGLLTYAGRIEAGDDLAGAAAAAAPREAAVFAADGGPAAAFLAKLRLRAAPAPAPTNPARGNPGFGLLVAEAHALEAPEAVEAARRHAEAGGRVLVLPAEPGAQQQALARLLGRPVSIEAHETYELEAIGSAAAVRGFSPVDLFGFDKPFLSPRDTVNRPLAAHRIEVEGSDVLCRSIEGTAWKDFFVHEQTAEYSRLALVELNRKNARESGAFVIEVPLGAGSVICSQILPDPSSDKALRLYARLFANLGAALDDGLLQAADEQAKWAVETVMALPCAPHIDYEEMKAYYVDPEFSLNNLGEGLYGWMKKRERRREDGMLKILAEGEEPWFLSVFVEVPETEPVRENGSADESGSAAVRLGRLALRTRNAREFELYLNGENVPHPERALTLRTGLNRMIAVVRGNGGPLEVGLNLLHEDGRPMKDLAYRLTLDEVEPK